MIDFFALIAIAIPATIIALFSSLFAIKTSSKILKLCFAIFIILVGIFYAIKTIILMVKKHN